MTDIYGTRITPGLLSMERSAVKITPNSTLAKGDIVAPTGIDTNSLIVSVAKADANTRAHTRGILFVATQQTGASGGIGAATPIGLIRNVDTSGGTVGDKVYLSNTAGGWSLTAGEWLRQIGTIVKAHATLGVISFNGLLPHDRTKTVSGTVLSGQTSLTITAATLGGSFGGQKIIGVVPREVPTNACYIKSVVWSTHDLVVTVNTDPGASNLDFDVTFSLE